MKYIVSAILLIISFSLEADRWHYLFTKHQSLIVDSTYCLLIAQYSAFVQNNVPSIADHQIKSISIIECGEELVDIATINNPRISVMNEKDLLLAHECIDDIDYRSPHHSLVRKSVYRALEKMIDELDRLAIHFGYQEGELCIKLFEGLRDIQTQKILFDACVQHLMRKNKSWNYTQAYQEACKWVSPYINNVPTHATGAAIDIHLWSNKQQNFCSMGRFNKGGLSAPTFSTDESLSEQQCANRFLFVIAATQAGLINYPYEFWHFSMGDRYACYWNKAQSHAIYDALQ